MARLNRLLTFALLAVLSFQLVIAGPGEYRIESLLDGTPLGVNYILPGHQPVYLKAPVNIWKIRKEENNKFQFSVGGYPYTGNLDDGVFATIDREQSVAWLVKYVELQNAYTIELPDSGKGWTVSPNSEDARVEIRPIIVLPSEPPRFAPSQLWRIVPVYE